MGPITRYLNTLPDTSGLPTYNPNSARERLTTACATYTLRNHVTPERRAEAAATFTELASTVPAPVARHMRSLARELAAPATAAA